ncbi:unnamed protein product [Rotaria sordida]|uniref:Uncharacterized protein n=1 Tax=Rotaria sordida TaxID=392033 RepID=A0A815D1E2_9BILA|nr:unnamed protein product [Rotaria sordida]CAF1292447.1 unnamed protein product [Rotaria sordida]
MMHNKKMDQLSETSILVNDKNQIQKKYSFTQLSIVREEDDNQIIINQEYENDKQSDISDFDIIESNNDNINELNEDFYLTLEHICQETSLSVLSTADLLRERLAFITGGTCNKSPILTFPDNPQMELTQDKYKKLVSYLTQVPSENERQLGFVIIIDRRSDRWMTVKSIMAYIEDYFPYSIQCIYLLRPNSWMQRALSRITILNEITCTHRLIVCRTLAELHEYLDASQLSKDLGGLIDFRLFEWIERRAAIEKLTQSIHELSEMLLVFIKQCDEIEFPNAVESTQQLLLQHSTQKNELEQELRRIKTWGHSLLCIIRQQHKPSSSFHDNSIDENNDIHNLILSPDQAAHARACANALTHVNNSESVLVQFWTLHESRLNRCLALRRFEQRFKEIQSNFIQLYNDIIQLPDLNTSLLLFECYRSDNSNTREEIDQTLIQVDDLSQRAQTMISHATLLANDGLDLIMEQQKQKSTAYGIDSIEPKCQELEEMKKKLTEQIDEKRHNLRLLRTYIDKLELINDWCTRGKDMLAMHPIHLSNDKAIRSLSELEHFLGDLSTINLDELQHTLTPEPLRSMIIQVFNRVNDVRDLCEKRCEQLRRLAIPINRPVQRVHPLPLQQSESLNLIGTTTSILQQQINEYYPSSDIEHNLSSSSSSSSNNNNNNNNNIIYSECIIAHNAKMDKKQRHVVTELLATEQVYVEELRIVIEGYMLKFDEPERYRYLPPAIIQNKSILFSNLPDIYAFHATSFLRDLQQIYDDSSLINTRSIGSTIAACFIKRKSNFKLYEKYVLNKSQSERIWEQFCSGHPFFTKIQQSLGHRLPLDSYLLKPIQRIAQYQLLLKEMIKYTRDEQERLHLQEALRVMLNILCNLNDVMHSTQIVGYSENLNTLGRIRLRGENCLISKEKRRGTVYTRTKTSTRDIFLFERDILLCKKKDEGNGKSIQYQFKEIIKFVDIAVCTHPKNDRNKFELVLKDWSYIIQLPNIASNGEKAEEMSIRWIDTIKSCVTHQTEQRRAEMKQRSASLDHSAHAHRRHMQHRATVTIRAPEFDNDNEESTLTTPLINIDNTVTKRNSKITMSNNIAHTIGQHSMQR